VLVAVHSLVLPATIGVRGSNHAVTSHIIIDERPEAAAAVPPLLLRLR